MELGKAMFKGFSIRQGEETFIKAVYFALEQACLEGKVQFLALSGPSASAISRNRYGDSTSQWDAWSW